EADVHLSPRLGPRRGLFGQDHTVRDGVAQRLRYVARAPLPNRVRPHLPNHEGRLLPEHIRLQASELGARLVSAPSTVEHLHHPPLLQSIRISPPPAPPSRRRGAYSHDLYRSARVHLLRQTRKRVTEGHGVGMELRPTTVGAPSRSGTPWLVPVSFSGEVELICIVPRGSRLVSARSCAIGPDSSACIDTSRDRRSGRCCDWSRPLPLPLADGQSSAWRSP